MLSKTQPDPVRTIQVSGGFCQLYATILGENLGENLPELSNEDRQAIRLNLVHLENNRKSFSKQFVRLFVNLFAQTFIDSSEFRPPSLVCF